MTKKLTRKDALLRLISDIGGEGTRTEINAKIPRYWKLSDKEREIKKGTGKPLYWHHVASICQALKDRNYYLENPSRSVWRITKAGENHLRSVELHDAEEVEITEEKFTAQETSLSIERDLQAFLCKDPGQIESGLKLFQNGKEFDTEVGRIDILAIDRKNDLLVIELKAGKARDDALGQLLGYMSFISHNLAKGKNVRGYIIANDFGDRLRYAVRSLRNVRLKAYRVSFSFEDVD